MTELLFESPVTVGITGLFLTVVAVVIWIQGGMKAALYAAVALGALTLILVLISINVVTDREQIERILYEVTAHVQQNQHSAVLTYIHPNAKAIADRARAELPHVKFSEARVTGVKGIEVNQKTKPPSATAEFNIVLGASYRGQEMRGMRQFVRLYFLKRDSKWLINDVEFFEPTAGFKEDAAAPRSPLEIPRL